MRKNDEFRNLTPILLDGSNIYLHCWCAMVSSERKLTMGYKVLALQGNAALGWDTTIKELLIEFSDEVSQKMENGEYDEILEESYFLPSVYFCLALEAGQNEVCGMYIATYMPAAIKRRLYVDCVVTAKKWRGRGIFSEALLPHMKSLGKELECETIDLTSAKPAAQSVYRKAGFEEPTTAFRLPLK